MSDVTVWRYSLPSEKGKGWGIVHLDNNGFFAAITDWGDYTHLWRPVGWKSPEDHDFRRWFLTLDDSYIIRKIGGHGHGPHTEIDHEGTIRAFREWICESRRSGGLSRTQARGEWENLDAYAANPCDESLHAFLQSSTIDAAYEGVRRRPTAMLSSFVRLILPRLRAAIREELARDEPTTVAPERATEADAR